MPHSKSLLNAAVAVLLLLFASTETESTAASDASTCSISSLRFHKVATVDGCRLYIHRSSAGGSSNATYFVEPALCIRNINWLNTSSPEYDPITSSSYIALPILMYDPKMLYIAERQLNSALRGSSQTADLNDTISLDSKLQFMELKQGRFAMKDNPHIQVEFLWNFGDNVGYLRVYCKENNCLKIGRELQMQNYNTIGKIIGTLQYSVNSSCHMEPQERAITISGNKLFIRHQQRLPSQQTLLSTCAGMKLVQTVHLRNSTVRVYKRGDGDGKYAILPTLSFEGKFKMQREDRSDMCCSLLLDFRLPDFTKDVRYRLRHLNPTSVDTMQLWDWSFEVNSVLRRWAFGPLEVSFDGQKATMKLFCIDWAHCRMLRDTINQQPMNFWRHVKWQPTGQETNTGCLFKPDREDFIFRPQQLSTGSSLQDYIYSRENYCTAWLSIPNQKVGVSSDGRLFYIIQQRMSDSFSFARNWSDYKSGFGDNYNFWMGLETIHSLTQPRGALLRIEMTDFNNRKYHAEYSGFMVHPASTFYTMTVDSYIASKSNIRDSFSYHSGSKFSTHDVDNDGRTISCSKVVGYSGWWFNSCFKSNLNGKYPLSNSTDSRSINWQDPDNINKLMKFSRMMILIG